MAHTVPIRRQPQIYWSQRDKEGRKQTFHSPLPCPQENQDMVLLTDYMYQETEKHNGNILREVRIGKPWTL